MSFDGSYPFFNDAVAGAPVNIKANGFCDISMLKLVNTTAATAYVQFFDKPAASVTLGTTTPYWTIRLAPNETTNPSQLAPLMFRGTGCSLAATTTATGNTGAAVSVSATYA